MGLEAATYIDGLVITNPVGATDPRSQGDDHLRLLKTTLKNTFPALTGAVTATQAEINQLHNGVLQTINAGSASAPAYSFTGDTNTGLYWFSADRPAMAAGGQTIMDWTTVRVYSSKPYNGEDGTALLPMYSFLSNPNTGLYRRIDNAVSFAANGTLAFEVQQNAAYANDGSVGVPSWSFFNDPDLGLYRISANVLGITAGGVQHMGVGGGAITMLGNLLVNDGSSGAPGFAFSGDTNTGIFRDTADVGKFVAGATAAGQWTAQGIGAGPDGTTGAPAFYFSNDLDTGIRRVGTNSLALVAGSADIIKIDTVASLITMVHQLSLTINSNNNAMGGAATALPANPVGYMAITLNGTQRRIPYYAD